MVTGAHALDRSARVELARAARRGEILAAARRVFAVRGFRGTTIADIAEEASIALGTIYLYFPSKEAVFAALNELLNELISRAISDVAAAGSLRETVCRRVDNVFAVCRRSSDLVRLVVLNTDPGSDVTMHLRRASDERIRPLVDELQRAIDAGTVRAGDASIMARLTSGLVSIAVYQAFVLSDGAAAERYAAECAEMITAYLSPATYSGAA